MGIECLDDVPPPPPLDDTTFAARMREGIAWMRQTTLGQPLPGKSPVKAPFDSDVPNTVGTPWSFRNSGVTAAGAVDVFYSMGRIRPRTRRGDGDARNHPEGPVSQTWMLWNRHMQTLEYQFRRSSLEHRTDGLRADGSYVIVISGRDPGVPNWLDTGGHRQGTIFWRYLLPETTRRWRDAK
jgi:hypothetical protein